MHDKMSPSMMAKRGRPPRGEFAEKRSNFNTRITDQLRQRLDQAAKENDRSLSQEIEMRLVRSFSGEDDPRISSFGKQPSTYAIFRLAAEAVKDVEAWTGGYWLNDRFTFELAVAAISAVLTSFTPEGDVSPPDTFPTAPDLTEWPDLKDLLRSRLAEQSIPELAYPIAAAAVARMQGAAAHAGVDNQFEQIWQRAAEYLGRKLTKPVLPLTVDEEGSGQ
jgi:hypothetical protein